MFNFDIDTVVTPAVKSAKTFSSMIIYDDVRKSMDALIDANADLTRSVYTTATSYFKKPQ